MNTISNDPIELLRTLVGRSGYGKDGKGEYRHALLKDMSNNWVKASIIFVKNQVVSADAQGIHIEDVLRTMPGIYERELLYRETMGIEIEDTEE